MKQLFEYANAYCKKSTWKDMALVKLCLFSMGVICGLTAHPKNKKPYLIACVFIFIATYIPLMIKFCSIINEENKKI